MRGWTAIATGGDSWWWHMDGLFRDWMLELPRFGCINLAWVAAAELWRGAAPIQWAVAARRDIETGVTTMRLDAGLDTGPMLLKRAVVAIAPEDHGRGSVRGTVAEIGVRS